MNYSYHQGDILVIELINSDEILEGEYIDGGKDRIVLTNITSYKNDVVIKGPYTYYRSDISSVRLLNERDSSEHTVTNSVNEERSVICINKHEYDRLQNMSRNYIYMSTLDSRYYDAMSYVKTCESIGLCGITTTYDRTADLNLIVICTWDEVYILDFLTIKVGKFPVELKEILECNYIKKALHDSRLLTEVLSRKFNVNLNNIFDIKVADVVIQKRKGVECNFTKDLAECLTYYFNFPETLIATEDHRLDKWRKRPISSIRKLKAAQMGTFLITLKNHLEGLLLEDFYKVVDEYSKSLHQYCMQEVPSKLLDNKLCHVLNNIKLS